MEVLDSEVNESPPPLDESAPNSANASISSLVIWLSGFLLLLQARHYIPNRAMDALVKFLGVLFNVLGRFCSPIASMARIFPSSLYRLQKSVKNSADFTKFVVCPKCHKLYKFNDCITVAGAHQSSSTCMYVKFPSHPQLHRRRECGHLLLKAVQLSSGSRIMYPFKVFPYKSLSSSLQNLLLRPGFADLCEQWKSREAHVDYQDVYDGKIWKDFQVVDGEPFLSSTHTLGLGFMINVDWFQPFKYSVHSVGVIYLTVMNLPRSVRFKRQNVILVGVIPGPSEPKHNINSYIEPLVEELLALWTGVAMRVQTVAGISNRPVKCALLCVGCDLPAGRKLCGFLGHSARLGCSKCLKEFPGSVGTMNYSGFERTQWPIRDNDTHRESVRKILQGKSKQQQNTLESRLGCRYSSLLKLPYFDAPRMLIIDPMHNLLLGTGKHMLHLWVMHKVISTAQFDSLQDCVDAMVVPSDIGRIPNKIASGFAGFTADQFKNWIVVFSIPALHGILPQDHFECWRQFVLACRILCKKSLTTADVILSDLLLLDFCKRVQRIYGELAITPNMHMHAHVKESVFDYGPVYAFWLFSYERFNGILGNQPNNNRAIESQLMNRFIQDNLAYSFQFPKDFHQDFNPLCSCDDLVVGSLGDTVSSIDDSTITPTSAGCRSTFDEADLGFVTELYRKLNPLIAVVNSVYVKYTSLFLRGKSYSCSKASRKGTQFVALAEWDAALFGPPPTPVPEPTHPDSKFRPVKVHYYIRVSATAEFESVSHLLLAVVSWHLPHPNRDIIGKPAQVWNHSNFECGGIYTFLPVQYLKCRCAFRVSTVEADPVLVIVPLVE